MHTIYIIGICGTGVGALAGLLKKQGYQVHGSDTHIYPPMSTKLHEWGIPVLEGYDAAHLQPHPDLVIVGNVVSANNPEAVYAKTHHLPTLSMPQAIAQFGIRDKHSIVVAGTHGKTTTTALTMHALMDAHQDPSYLVGGALVGYTDSFRDGTGPHFVIEGDEYDTAYFDKRSKFLHYKARTAIITSLEYDHADIFPSIEAVENTFAQLIAQVPTDGHLVVWHGAERALRLLRTHAVCTHTTIYATHPTPEASLYARSITQSPQGLTLETVHHNQFLGTCTVPMWGMHNAANILAVIGALLPTGLSFENIAKGLASFKGVKRRMEIRGEPRGITVVDDFAHHPTAVETTLQAARVRWPQRKIWALFEPRSATTRRNVFQHAFAQAFTHADAVIVASHSRLHEIPEDQRFSPEQLAQDLRSHGTQAWAIPNIQNIATHVATHAQPGDVIMVLSNGDFGGLHTLLLSQLETSPMQH
jgi:UDP-N-acetylmuramate: L-alanyl-gamma-D-glutamyl-meso-diaminopimelate ligase